MFVEYKGKNYKAKESLKLSNLGIKRNADIHGLEKLTSLKKLDLDKNEIEEIEGLDHLKELEFLSLQHNKINEIKGLEYLINLSHIYLFDNPIYKSLVEDFGKKYRDNAHLLVEYCQKRVNITVLDEFTKLIKKVLIFEFNNQRLISKSEMIKELSFTIDEVNLYYKMIEEKYSYNKIEKPKLKDLAENVLKVFPSPTLYDLIVTYNLYYKKAKKLGKYLLEEGWINEFSKFPLKEKIFKDKSEKKVEVEAKILICPYCGETLGKKTDSCPYCKSSIKF